MLAFSTLSLFLSGLTHLAMAAPFTKRAGVTPVPLSVVSSLDVYTQMAKAAYYPGLRTWSCGSACDAVPGMTPYASGGDGGETPFWFVGYWETNRSVVIIHEGTNASSLDSWLNDLDVWKDPMDATFFPGAPPTMRVHGGFQSAFIRSATPVTDAVTKALADRGTDRLTIVGHSLGGAISILETAYFRMKMPSLVIKTVVYGAPRVGNLIFADYLAPVDLTRINNKRDPVPVVPGTVFDFQHPHGEIHINGTGHWNYCAGQENTDPQCTAAPVAEKLAASLSSGTTSTPAQDHSGPYNGITM